MGKYIIINILYCLKGIFKIYYKLKFFVKNWNIDVFKSFWKGLNV